MARVIWDRRENPSEYVSDQLGITREQLGTYDDGTVTDESGYVLGNIYNEI
jgi:hypothetical protein